jgi:tetratricopeptide (TPR) repeat protein
MDSLSWLSPTVEGAYSLAPTSAEMTLSLIRASAGAEVSWRPDRRFALHGFATGGGFYGVLEGRKTGNAFGMAYRAGAGLSYRITPTFGLTAGAAYGSFPGLYDGLSAFLGTRLTFGDETGFDTGPKLRIRDPQLDTIFPVLFKYYDSNPLGSVQIENTSDEPVRDVRVEIDVPQYMESPDVSAELAELGPGERTEVELTALMTNEVLTTTEGTKVTANLSATHAEADEAVTESVTLSTYDRNALRWDDDKKIGAFVTARDDEIQSFAKNVAALSRENRIDAVNQELQLAMAQYAAIVEHGTSYVVDPSSAYEELSQNPFAVDFVQFPRQTLQFRAGDCDDLSATYAALLESVGISTAFITIPGHIYMAFELDMSAEAARRAFSNPNELIFREDGSVWVPMETTALEQGFSGAWATGARQWRKHNPEGEAGFFRTAEAWSTYQPVAFSVSDIDVRPPAAEEVVATFRNELDRFVERELQSRKRRFVERLQENPDDVRTRNRLAVLYGRYGKYEDAREQLRTILEQRSSYAPAHINLGNVAFMAQQYRAAHRH